MLSSELSSRVTVPPAPPGAGSIASSLGLTECVVIARSRLRTT